MASPGAEWLINGREPAPVHKGKRPSIKGKEKEDPKSPLLGCGEWIWCLLEQVEQCLRCLVGDRQGLCAQLLLDL